MLAASPTKARATYGLNAPDAPSTPEPQDQRSAASAGDCDCSDDDDDERSIDQHSAAMCASRSASSSTAAAAAEDLEPMASDAVAQKKRKRSSDSEQLAPGVAASRPRLIHDQHLTAATTTTTRRLLSPLDAASADEIRQHVRDVRREVFSRPLLALITRLMFHKSNHGLFNVRVDPVAWNIPHYLEVVKRPMDLSLVKSKCLNLEYASADACAADVRLVFANACLFNPPGHAVHEAAKLLRLEFDAEYARLDAKEQALDKKRADHSCPSCLANVCAICNQKCINFEPPFVMCSGACRQRIKRHSLYFMTPDRSHHWCGKCYASLPKVLKLNALAPAASDAAAADNAQPPQEMQLAKNMLMKAKFVDELTEPWVQCDRCNGWVHQICALFNACEDSSDGEEAPYACPLCRIDELASVEQSWDVEMSPSATSVDQFPLKSTHKHALELMGSHSPVLKRKPTAKEFTRALGFDTVIEKKVFDFLGTFEAAETDTVMRLPIDGFVTSQQLRSSALSRFMQAWVREHLEKLGERDAAQSIVVKVVSSIKSSCQVSPVVREHFRSERQSVRAVSHCCLLARLHAREWRSTALTCLAPAWLVLVLALQYPPSVEFTSKAIFVFQKIDGVEVCIFSMYVALPSGVVGMQAIERRRRTDTVCSLILARDEQVCPRVRRRLGLGGQPAPNLHCVH